MKYVKFLKYIYSIHLFTLPFPVLEKKKKNIQYAFKKPIWHQNTFVWGHSRIKYSCHWQLQFLFGEAFPSQVLPNNHCIYNPETIFFRIFNITECFYFLPIILQTNIYDLNSIDSVIEINFSKNILQTRGGLMQTLESLRPLVNLSAAFWKGLAYACQMTFVCVSLGPHEVLPVTSSLDVPCELEEGDLEDSTTHTNLGVPRACRSGEGVDGSSPSCSRVDVGL